MPRCNRSKTAVYNMYYLSFERIYLIQIKKRVYVAQ